MALLEFTSRLVRELSSSELDSHLLAIMKQFKAKGTQTKKEDK